MMVNTDNIHELKCPYCGDVAMQDYGPMVNCDYNSNSHWALWDIDCPVCGKHYYYTEEYTLTYAVVEKE